MTREEAKKIVRGITDKIECNTTDIDDWAEFWGFTREDYEEFLDMAIKALEQKPCNDTVSRKDAKSFLYERLNRLNNDELYDIFSIIIDDMYNELPSVQLKSGWIPVTTRPLTEEEKQEIEEQGERYCRFMYDCELPDDGQEVLITTSGGYVIGTTFYNEGIDGCYFECYEDEGDVKAWMPLPEPYEADMRGEE